MIEIRPISDWRYPASTCRLDSATGGGAYSRWSYRLGPARQIVRCQRLEQGASLYLPGQVHEPLQHWPDPADALAFLASEVGELPANLPGPPLKGGWVGFIGYDAAHLFEDLPARARDDLALPIFEFHYIDSLDARGPDGKIWAIDRRGTLPQQSRSAQQQFPGNSNHGLVSNFSPVEYCSAVAKAIEYIRAGDVFQVNLSQRFTTGLGSRQPWEIYNHLQTQHPAWYGALLSFDDYALLSNSPELFLRVEPTPDGRRVTTRPIKGTRPLGTGMRDELAASIKDQAELNMIIDLERNDLGRICQIGTVAVRQPRIIEQHATVYHGVASIEGILRDDVGFLDLLRATFPSGSVTGAPKIRAMQIIDELEPVRRGPYCGAIGYLSIDGHIEFNIAIRTMIVTGGQVHIPVGAGIVADSDPQAEYEETLVKARAMFAAMGIKLPALGD